LGTSTGLVKRTKSVSTASRQKGHRGAYSVILDAKVNLFQWVVGELDMILGPLDEKREFEDILMDMWLAARNEEELAQGADDLGDELLVVKTGTHGVMDQYQFEYQPDYPVKRCLLPHGVWTHGRAVCLSVPLT